MTQSLINTAILARDLAEKRAGDILQTAAAEGRAKLNDDEARELVECRDAQAQAEQRVRQLERGTRNAQELDEAFRARFGGPEAEQRDQPGSHPLAVRPEVLDAVQTALDGRLSGKWEARAALTTGETGGRRTWSANELRGPRLLHVAAGVPTGQHDAVQAAYLKAGAITAAAPVGENISVAELANLTTDTATLQRYGRFTEMSREAKIASGTAGTISTQHRTALARDLDNAFVTQLLTTAVSGTDPIASTTGLASLRMAVATVCDATGAEPGSITIAVPPAMAPVLQEVHPTGGATVAEPFTTFAGARVYFSSFVTADTAVVFDGQGFRYFEAQGVTFETDVNVKTGTDLFATSLIGGYGYNLLPGAAVRADLSPGA